MASPTPPTVMVLDGNHANSIQVATELSEDLGARIIGVGTSDGSRLLRSRYCDIGATTVAASHPRYADRLSNLLNAHAPDLLLPLSAHSVAAVDDVRDRLPESVACWLPPSDSLDVAFDKLSTVEAARSLDVDTPADYTSFVRDLDDRGRPDEVNALPYPVFLKARIECGRTVTAKVDGPAAFWETYDDLRGEAPGGVIVQEYVPDDRTFGCGLLYEDGRPRLLFAHEELRSVPRRGGTGTRVRILREPRIETASLRLLDELDWHGPALVEFKRRPDGSYTLMEINPKFWASYALASQTGYRFASTLASLALDLPAPRLRRVPEQTGEMVFPLQELYYAATHPDESVLRSAARLLWPTTAVDVNGRDLRAWLSPPVGSDDTSDERDAITGEQDDTPGERDDTRDATDDGGDAGP